MNGMNEAVLQLVRDGYSVIPVAMGIDGWEDKRARVAWAPYMTTCPTSETVQEWLDKGLFTGVAVVCGDVSGGLLCLDIDDYHVAEQFEGAFPELCKTMKHASRRGVHYFYKVNREVKVRNVGVRGVGDVLWYGKYVVMPPTFGYANLNEDSPQHISQDAYNDIIAFMARVGNRSVAPSGTIAVEQQGQMLTLAQVATYYRSQLRVLGRNTALFNAARLARDHGHSAYECLTGGLLDEFVMTTREQARKELPERRLREGRRTIESAFGRPARRRDHDSIQVRGLLSDDARERLCKVELDEVARVFDALVLAGFAPKRKFTRQEARRALKGVVGRHSINAALESEYGGKRLFTRSVAARFVASSSMSDFFQPLNAFIRGGLSAKPVLKGGVGGNFCNPKPQKVYIMPSAEDIQRRTGAVYMVSTRVGVEDLSSIKAYRARLERGFIERKAGQYSRQWLAQRLGVANRTVYNYHKHTGIYTQAMYKTFDSVTWHNLDHVFNNEFDGATFISAGGRKYPAKRGVAIRLLSKHLKPVIQSQTTNYYSSHKPSVVEQKTFNFGKDFEHLLKVKAAGGDMGTLYMPGKGTDFSVYWQARQNPDSPSATQATGATDTSAAPVYREGMTASDLGGQWLEFFNATHDDLRGMGLIRAVGETDGKNQQAVEITRMVSDKSLSYKTTCQLIDTYGYERVKNGVRLVLIAHRESAVKNMAGKLMATLRMIKLR